MEFKSNKAIYLQIADHVCEQILLKKWQIASKVPSVRELAVSMEVNPNTVMRTYSYLEEKGIISMRRGIGFFVTNEALNNAVAIKKQEFIEDEMPGFFKAMDLLNITFDDLKQLYESNYRNLKERQ